jgi:CRP-like cAMP-binding protein
MSKNGPRASTSSNRILARLPQREYLRLLPALQQFRLEFKRVLYAPGAVLDHVYFPEQGVISMIALMENGTGIEVATIGNEGMLGLPVFLGERLAPAQFLIQVPGTAMRMRADTLRAETELDCPLRRLVRLYCGAFSKQVWQGVACNGLHPIQERCRRWLLMTHDRVEGDVFPLTHEFLALMLGVRRASVTEVLQPLQEQGLIRYHRGKITVLDRQRLEDGTCECYRRVNEEFDRVFP